MSKVKQSELEATFAYLNRAIQCRLALSELPYQLKRFKIERGCVEFIFIYIPKCAESNFEKFLELMLASLTLLFEKKTYFRKKKRKTKISCFR